MSEQQAGQVINVGEVTKKIENGEATYQVGPHQPRGFMVHVGFDWLMFGGLLLLEYVVLFRTPAWGTSRFAAAAMGGPFLLGFLALALHETWWRRVCIDGTERMVVRGSLLIHSGEAFGHGREWQRRLDKVRRVVWLPRGSPQRYVSSVTLWCAFPNMFAVGWGLESVGGEWLARELAAHVEQSRSSKGG